MKICVISDTHNKHHSIEIPKCDLLIHCGDFSMGGTQEEFKNFAEWWMALPMPRVVVPGNHDKYLNRMPLAVMELNGNGSQCLIDRTESLCGLVIHGTPWVPYCGAWAWTYSDPEKNPFNIPSNTNILVTHSPAYQMMDQVKWAGPVGSRHLANYVDNLLPNLKLHCFGHIHEGYGVREVNGIIRVNAAQLDERYQHINKPIMVEL